jgi:hypothetical protein
MPATISRTPKTIAAASSVMPGQTRAQIPAAIVRMPKASIQPQCFPIRPITSAERDSADSVVVVIAGLLMGKASRATFNRQVRRAGCRRTSADRVVGGVRGRHRGRGPSRTGIRCDLSGPRLSRSAHLERLRVKGRPELRVQGGQVIAIQLDVERRARRRRPGVAPQARATWTTARMFTSPPRAASPACR